MQTDERFTVEAWAKLARQWELEEITLEQFNGQMLVWIGHVAEALERSEREQESLGHALADLDARLQGLAARLP